MWRILPPLSKPGLNYLDMQDLVQDALEQVHSVTQDEINQLAGKAMKFKMGDFELPFVAENIVQSFSMPHFYFHATMTYSILRMQEIPIGKMDFLGNMRNL